MTRRLTVEVIGAADDLGLVVLTLGDGREIRCRVDMVGTTEPHYRFNCSECGPWRDPCQHNKLALAIRQELTNIERTTHDRTHP